MSAEELAKENAELRRKLGERENRDKEPKWDTGDTQHEHKGRRREKTDHTKDARDSRQGEERKKKPMIVRTWSESEAATRKEQTNHLEIPERFWRRPYDFAFRDLSYDSDEKHPDTYEPGAMCRFWYYGLRCQKRGCRFNHYGTQLTWPRIHQITEQVKKKRGYGTKPGRGKDGHEGRHNRRGNNRRWRESEQENDEEWEWDYHGTQPMGYGNTKERGETDRTDWGEQEEPREKKDRPREQYETGEAETNRNRGDTSWRQDTTTRGEDNRDQRERNGHEGRGQKRVKTGESSNWKRKETDKERKYEADPETSHKKPRAKWKQVGESNESLERRIQYLTNNPVNGIRFLIGDPERVEYAFTVIHNPKTTEEGETIVWGLKALYRSLDAEFTHNLTTAHKDGEVILNISWDTKEDRALLIFSMENWKKKREENKWNDKWLQLELDGMRVMRIEVNRMMTDLIALQEQEQEDSSNVTRTYVESENVTELISQIKDRLTKQMLEEAHTETRRLEVNEKGRIKDNIWKNVAGLLAGIVSMSQSITMSTLCTVVDTKVERAYPIILRMNIISRST